MSEQQYIDYFSELASLHKAIRHSDATRRFYVLDENQAELRKAQRTIEFPILLVDPYLDDLDTAHDNYQAKIMGGVNVLVQCRKGDVFDERRARDEARRIARSVLFRLRRDCLSPGGKFQGKNIKPEFEFRGEPAPDLVPNAVGWGYSFELWLPSQVAVDPGDWIDL
ncbi:hypothetical protein DYU11_20980 [Fibrisoma montanum]|uniref:Uncharacterized protein n=1 Tax=Fibrisoma montanum TaxID=2305895 RepID=A0A418M427_9BACT|nr:hypothetical protein [Fibrisoma montanum]RIV20522.1 hypothetical protein DYU11_20980 [Fibrisoma montanum]